uniref:Putative leucine-rich repeat extensin-like protein 6-like n=1 Tax=Solanum chacoense TaxID=4108 RepID=A0A0V0HBQ6_SOLCH
MGVKLAFSIFIVTMMITSMENEGNLVNANGTTWAGSKYQIECTMCAACDNPCATPSPPPPQPPSPPPPSPPPPSTSYNCPPPPSHPSSGGNYYYYSPPPPPPSSLGGGNYYYSPPPPYQNYPSGPTPPPPNPIVPYFPFYFYNPPPPSQSAAFKLTVFSPKSSIFVTVFIALLIFH